MARTVFVNPTYHRRKRRKNAHKRRRHARRNAMMPVANPRRHRRRRARRRNAGIAPFVSNPLIMSNPPRHRRRKRHQNPLNLFTVKNLVSKGLTYGGGGAIALGANVLAFNRIQNIWWRNVARFGGAVLAGGVLRGELGAATAGASFYPIWQDLAAKFMGGTAAVSGTEADIDALAADLEDVMDELDESDLSDDDDWDDDDLDVLS